MPLAERHGNVIRVETQWIEKELIKSIPGSSWNTTEKIWTVPLTWAACLQLRGIFTTSLNIGPELNAWAWEESKKRVKPATILRSEINRVPGYHDKLYDFQTAGASFLLTADNALLGDDMGMGKTAQMLSVVAHLIDNDVSDALPALVICPNTVKAGWVHQIEKWNVDVHAYVITGSAAQRRKQFAAAAVDPRAFVIVNIEAVRQFSRLSGYGSINLKKCRECDKRFGEEGLTATRCEVHPKELNTMNFRTVILDEAHRIKDPTSKQSRACWAVSHGPSVRHRYAMTGTPVANHVGDLWSIMHFIEPKEYPTKSKFVDRYALQSWNAFGGMDIVGVNPHTKDEFYSILDPRFRRTPKALVLTQLPRVVRPTRYVDMTPKQAVAYNDMSTKLLTTLDTGEVLMAKNHLIGSLRLMQLASSYCDVDVEQLPIESHSFGDDCLGCGGTTDTGHKDFCQIGWKYNVTLREPSPKLDAMEEAYDELGGKSVVIVAQSRQLIDLAAKRFAARKIPYGLITGPVSEYDRHLAIQQFRNNKINVILMTISAGGTGVDGLQHADTMFVLQRSWSMIHNVQVDGRVDRIGSEKHDSVTIVDFVTRGTIEEEVLFPRLVEKYNRLEEINRDRSRLLAAGVDPSELYQLDNDESLVLSSNLGIPDTNVTAQLDEED